MLSLCGGRMLDTKHRVTSERRHAPWYVGEHGVNGVNLEQQSPSIQGREHNTQTWAHLLLCYILRSKAENRCG